MPIALRNVCRSLHNAKFIDALVQKVLANVFVPTCRCIVQGRKHHVVVACTNSRQQHLAYLQLSGRTGQHKRVHACASVYILFCVKNNGDNV
eukprot:XP_001704329.1 Hypothetical protein GL50803_37989 [Giardia lamblia ATCC 50803]